MSERLRMTLWLLAWIVPIGFLTAALLVEGPVNLAGDVLCVAFFLKASPKLELLAA